MSNNWIKKHEEAARERQKNIELFRKRKKQKIKILQDRISSRLKSVYNRITPTDSWAWRFRDWHDEMMCYPERLYFEITRYSGIFTEDSPRYIMRFVTTVDTDSIELYFFRSLYEGGPIKSFFYRFPPSYQITDDDIRQWFKWFMGEYRKPWKAGRKFHIRRRSFD